MKLPRLLLVLLLLLVAGLGVLATMQYRWIDRVSDAERERMRGNLEFAARRLADELSSELDSISRSGGDRPHELIEAVYSVERTEDGAWMLEQVDLETGERSDAAWPASFAPIREALAKHDPEEARERRPRWPPPLFGDVPALFVVERPPGPPGPELFMPPPRITLVQLSRRALTESVLPSLVQRHFSTGGHENGDEYDVALATENSVLYRSSPSWPDGRSAADAEAIVRPPMRGAGPRGGGPPGGGPRGFGGPPSGFGGPPPGLGPPRGDRPPPRPDDWRVLVRRRNGGLEATVAAARRRNLALSLVILAILGATIALLLALLRRADRLRRQQNEFVAAITHDLNTPIAALRSAGENLKDGIISDREKLARYGAVIVTESSRLGDMVAQVLEFAGMQAQTQRARGPVDLASVVEDAVSQSRTLTLGTPIAIELHVDPELPAVSGDAAALTRAIHNLIANAIRHGGSGNWVGVRAERDARGGVTISVEDRGPGIDSRDAARVFEPFFRGRNSASVRGTGLGLAIVRQIATDHGGSVTLDRPRGGGTTFTIHLPAVPA